MSQQKPVPACVSRLLFLLAVTVLLRPLVAVTVLLGLGLAVAVLLGPGLAVALLLGPGLAVAVLLRPGLAVAVLLRPLSVVAVLLRLRTLLQQLGSSIESARYRLRRFTLLFENLFGRLSRLLVICLFGNLAQKLVGGDFQLLEREQVHP